MASATVGLLRVLLSMDTGELETGAKRASSSLKAMSRDVQNVFDRFTGDKVIKEAHAYAQAIEKVGGASKLTAIEQQNVNRVITEALSKYAALGQQAPKNLMDLANATKQLEIPTQKASALAGVLGSAFGQFTAAGLATTAITKLVGGIGDLVSQGAKLPGLTQSFQRLAAGAGQSAEQMLAAMEKGTRGLVTNIDLMQSANKAMLLGLPVTAKSMGELSEAATKLGKAMGLDATQSLNDLITALGRSSPLILDNLGLTVKVDAANKAYADTLGKLPSQLTEAERKTAFYNAAMEAARIKTAELGEQTKTLGEVAQTAWTKFSNGVTGAVGVMNSAIPKVLSNMAKFKVFAAAMASGLTVGKALETIEELDRLSAKQGGRKDTNLALPVDPLVAYRRELDGIAASIVRLTPAQAALAKRGRELGQSIEQVATALNVSTLSIEAWDKGVKRSEASSDRLKKQFVEVRKIIDSLSFSIGPPDKLPGTVIDGNALSKWFFGAEVPDIGKPIELALMKLPGQLVKMPDIPAIPLTLAQKIFGSGKEFSIHLGQALSYAFSSIGTIADKLKLFATNFAKDFAASILSFIPVIGPMLSQLAGPIVDGIKKLFGGLFGGTAGRDSMREFFKQMGGEDALRSDLVNKLGLVEANRLMTQLYQTGRNNQRQAESNIKAITDALAAADAKQADFNKSLGGMLQQVQRLGGALPESLRTYLRELERGGRLTQENIDLLNQLSSDGEVDWKTIQEAVQRYGGDIEKLGGSFQSQRLHESWQQVIDDIDLFARGNISASDILSLTKGKIIELVDQSRLFGTEIPENMKPWIQQLIDSGELLDATTGQIIDINSLTFGETLQTTLQTLNATLKELVDTFRTVPGAIAAIPRRVDIEVGINPRRSGSDVGDEGALSFAARGGLVGRMGVRYFGAGGSLARGTDTVPAMLTPGELILNAAQQSNLADTFRTAMGAVNMMYDAPAMSSIGRPMTTEPLYKELVMVCDSREFARMQVPVFPGEARRLGVRVRNR